MDTLMQMGHWTAGKSARLIPPHTNPGLEIVFVANGAVSWDYDGLPVDVPAGHVSYSWPWQVHGAQDVKLPAVDLYWILIPLLGGDASMVDANCRLECNYGMKPSEERSLLDGLWQLESPVLSVTRDFRFSFTRLVKALIRKQGKFDMEARGLFALSMYQLQQSLGMVRRQEEGTLGLVQVRDFWDGLQAAELEHNWTLDEMAEACGMGRSSFAVFTKQLYGDTPIPVLTRKRLDFSKELLDAARLSITEIALCCGFNSSQHFATVFKAYLSMTPSAYRSS